MVSKPPGQDRLDDQQGQDAVEQVAVQLAAAADGAGVVGQVLPVVQIGEGPAGQGVGQEEVFALFKANLERLTGILTRTIEAMPDPDGCSCSTWADGIDLTYDIP